MNTTKFDKELEKIEIFKQYPQLMPFVGIYYNNNPKKLLLIGESNYLPTESEIHKTEKWYNNNIKNLTADEIDWSNSKGIILSHENQNNYKEININFHKFYRHTEEAILELDSEIKFSDKENMFKYVTFYNYFLRPGNKGNSISITEKDKEIANKVFLKITEIIKPQFVIFLSVKAFKVFMSSEKCTSISV